MKRTLVVCLAAASAWAPMVSAQDKADKADKDIDAQIKKAEDAADADMKQPAKAPDTSDDADDSGAKEEAKEKAQKKAQVQAVLDAKGPATLPAWAPAVPQFTASGPAVRKLVDGEPRIVLVGTSPVAPAALADAWDAFKQPNFSHERTGSEINGLVDLSVSYTNGEDGTQVTMEAERDPGAKVTQVTLSSPIPLPQ